MKISKILVLGSTGLLGNTVVRELSKNRSYHVTGTYRDPKYKQDLPCEYIYFDANNRDIRDFLSVNVGKYDYVINCIGLIKPHLTSTDIAIRVNTLLPLEVADIASYFKTRFIHITSDCVFTGNTGNYTEDDEHDMIDLYGRTKSLGEPDNCMVLRTSIIGPELHSYVSLMDWVRRNKNLTIDGYINHFWNGITTKQYSEVCQQIIDNNLYEESKFHIHSPNTVSKYELVDMFINKFNLDHTVCPHSTPGNGINRSLMTVKSLNRKLNIPGLQEQVENLD